MRAWRTWVVAGALALSGCAEDAAGTAPAAARAGVDLDGDGHAAGADCDDADATVYPGAPEAVGDAVDQDCDGVETCWEDADDDGLRSNAAVAGNDVDCDDPFEAPSADPIDCDELKPAAYPGSAETVDNGKDEDCVGGEACFADADQDGFRSAYILLSKDLDCLDFGEARATFPVDCDDADAAVQGGAGVPEIPDDGIDQDCDGGDTCWADADEDGARDVALVASAELDCIDPGEAHEEAPLDCDDADPRRSPAYEERCDGVDNDCDRAIDDGLALTDWWADADLDGYGDPASPLAACAAPDGHVADATDCDDGDPGVHPGAADAPGDAVDQDCDGSDAVPAEDTDAADTDSPDTDAPDTDAPAAEPPEDPKGCAAVPGPATGWAALAALLLSRRARRSPTRTPASR